MANPERSQFSFARSFYLSDVDASTQPCPLLSSSSSLSSTLLIPNTNTHPLPITTDIISPKPTHALLAPSSHSYEYYTRRRIEQLHERMDDIQISSFLKFINYHLSAKDEHKLVKDLAQDLSNGHVLLDLIEIFSSTKLKREHGRTRFHSLTNVQYVLDYLKSHMQHINISPHEIVSGNRKQILALLWIIMKIFDFPSFRITTNKHLFQENALFAFGQDRSVLLKWLNNLLNKILNTSTTYVRDFYLHTWMDCSYLSLIVKYLSPLSFTYGTLEYFDYVRQIDEFDSVGGQQKDRFDLYLKLANYCFQTMLTMDYTDQTEKSLFRFFSELQQNVLFIIKSNQIGKLTKANPYTKQLLDSLLETTSTEHAPTGKEDEDYLVFVENKQQQGNAHENLQSVNGHSLNGDILFLEESVVRPAHSGGQEDFYESSLNTKPSSPPADLTSPTPEQPILTQHLSEILSSITEECHSGLRSRKAKKKRSIAPPDRLPLPPTSAAHSNKDVFITTLECLRDPKLRLLRYIFVLACICFSVLLVFIHK